MCIRNRAFSIIATMSIGLTTGCSWIFDDSGYLQDHSDDYLTEEVVAPIDIPPSLLGQKPISLYPIPDVEQRLDVDKKPPEIPSPPRLVIAPPMEPVLSVELDLPKAKLTTDGHGYPIVVLTLSFDEAWAKVGEALTQMPYRVDDRDRGIGVYYLLIADGEKEKEYQLKLLNTANGVQVGLQVDEDTLADKQLSAQVMKQLYQHLQ